MASIPGRPFNVGFTFRIIAAPPSVSLIYNVTVYSYNTATAALETTTELADGARLARGSYIEHTVGRGNDKFTVVHISCNTFCEVRIIISIYMFMAICWLCAKLNSISISMAYFTTIVTLLFDENDIFISLESSIHALQDGCSISVGYKI